MNEPAITRLRTAFAQSPEVIARAPGRVNLIGEHTDYNDGFVLPAAIGVATLVAARRRDDGQVRVRALDLPLDDARFDLDRAFASDRQRPWADYVRAMVTALAARGHRLTGADLAITGTIPRGAGLSSSASLCVAVGTAMAAIAGLQIDAEAIALAAQAAEVDYVGTRCGVMDQIASACGQANHALLLDCRSLARTPIPIPADVAILIVHSGVTRGLVEGAYNARRAQCEAAARVLGVAALRDAAPAMLAAAQARMDGETMARARHVISENLRVLDAAAALRAGDLPGMGRLMAASHASMRDDFAITVPAIDALTAELQDLIGADGGARMTGGGFGGAVVALCRRERAEAILSALRYRRPDGAPPLILQETAGGGATLLEVG